MAGRNASNEEDVELIPAMILVVCLVVGGYVARQRPFVGEVAYINVILVGLSALGVLYVVWGFHQVRAESGTHTAVSWLFSNISENDERSPSDHSSTEKTPPTPESLKIEIRNDRAGRACEYCNEASDFLEVHHIEPRSEGGPNTRTNLIALCPSCHRKADRGVYSRSELNYMVRENESRTEA